MNLHQISSPFSTIDCVVVSRLASLARLCYVSYGSPIKMSGVGNSNQRFNITAIKD